jgi:hypothetical protein
MVNVRSKIGEWAWTALALTSLGLELKCVDATLPAMQWISQHSDLLFGGLGTAILVGVVGWILKRFIFRETKPVQAVNTAVSAPTQTVNVHVVSAPVPVNMAASLPPDEPKRANPAKSSPQFDLTTEKRNRDLRTLQHLLMYVPWSVVRQHLQNAPKTVSKEILVFWESVDEFTGSPTFHLYDDKLAGLLGEFMTHWHASIDFGERYESLPGKPFATFTYSSNRKQRELEERDWKQIEEILEKLRKAMDQLVGYLRREYIELDLEELESAALKGHLQ